MDVPYYQGRPAWLIKAAMPGRAEPAAKSGVAKPTAAAASDGVQGGAWATPRNEADARAAAGSNVWDAWAANWFTAPR